MAVFGGLAIMPDHAEEFLAQAARLLRLQADALEKQSAVRTPLAARIEGASATLAKAGLAVISLAAAAIVGATLAGAIASHSVVVDPVLVPKTLADQGYTGQAVAAALLDALSRTQAATRIAGHKPHLTEAWNEPIRLEIPETRLSLADLRSALARMLSGDIHVGGAILQRGPGDFVLVVRGGGIPARSFPLTPADIGKAMTPAADYIYGTAEPVAYATYLLQHFDGDGAVDFLRRAYATAPAGARPSLAMLWARASAFTGDFAAAVELDRMALYTDHYDWDAWEELAQDERLLEGPESERGVFRAMEATAAQAPANRHPPPTAFLLEYNLLHDTEAEIAALLQDRQSVSGGTTQTADWYNLAMAELDRHGTDAARRYLREASAEDPLLEQHVRAVQSGLTSSGGAAARLRALQAADDENWKITAYRNMIPDGPCALAIAYAQAGRKGEALATLRRAEAQNPAVGCGGNGAMVYEALGDRAAADQAFARVVAAEPSLPEPYEQRGEVLAARGETAAAADAFARAHARAPHWADPLKYEADARAKLGCAALAHARYGEALRYAPEWPELIAAYRATAGAPSGCAAP